MLLLWILISTENYPDASFSAFDVSNVYQTFFILYLLVTTFYLMPYMLSLTEDSYQELQEQRASSEFVNERMCLARAFVLLTGGESNPLPKAKWIEVVQQSFGWSSSVAERLFVVIDVDGDETVSLSEFLLMSDLAALRPDANSGLMQLMHRWNLAIRNRLPNACISTEPNVISEAFHRLVNSECVRVALCVCPIFD
jgi:hypothetical protein